MRYLQVALLVMIGLLSCTSSKIDEASVQGPPKKVRALIIDGENNHGVWPKTTIMMKRYLEQTDLFIVDVERTKYTWQGPHYDKSIGVEDITDLLELYPVANAGATISVEEPQADPDFSPDFTAYDLVINNMGWKASTWPAATKKNFEKYMKGGGGLIIVHAANNSWGDWSEYNKMIGLGGWGGRTEKDGPYVYFNDAGDEIRDAGEGDCGSHGPQHEYVMTTRAGDHPIMRGLPAKWMHAKDELYDRLRGPATNMTVLATAYSDVEGNAQPWNKEVKGTGRHEPLLIAVEYGKGRIFHTVLGHMDYSMECVGFVTTLQRGAEWAATGEVTQGVPSDFPDDVSVSKRKWSWKSAAN